MIKPISFNAGEAIFEPFWDPQISHLDRFTITADEQSGADVYQNWCFIAFRFERAPKDAPVFTMRRVYEGGLSCSGFDRMLLSAMNVAGGVLTLQAVTDAGNIRLETPPGGVLKEEYELPLQGASRIDELTLSLTLPQGGKGSGWINWIGLRNDAMYAAHRAQFRCFDRTWEGYLQGEDFEPTFTPTYAILAGKNELAAMRAQHEAFVKEKGLDASPYVQNARAAQASVPEDLISDFVNFWGDTRYCRADAHNNIILTKGMDALIAAYLLKDKDLLRLAARYAMSIAMCRTWDDGMICSFPGGPFEHRCFVQNLCALETAMILDLAGEYFTDLGRDIILRRISESAMAHINFSTWKHEYIFNCNQMAWFSPGRMYGYGVLLPHYPRVRRYMDIAFDELTETLEKSLQPDGGYPEGPTYFQCVGNDGGRALLFYARATGGGLEKVRTAMPERVYKTADFAEALMSTDETTDVVPICDASAITNAPALAIMAYLLPQSQWTAMHHKAMARAGLPASPIAWLVAPQIPQKAPALRPFVQLPITGHVSSLRLCNGKKVKWFLPGNVAGAGHTHEDKGSFVLEYDGETFCMDPGTCSYASPISADVQKCERHNMLLPDGLVERPHPRSPLPYDIHYAAAGDETSFTAAADLTPGWDGFYALWKRVFTSPAPDAMTITDEYRALKGTGVRFCLSTRQSVQATDTGVVITGRKGSQVIVTAPQGSRIVVEELPLLEGVQRRVSFVAEGLAGTLRTTFTLR